MDLEELNEELCKLLQSDNGCQYTDLQDAVIDTNTVKSLHNFNVLHLNIRSFHKNTDNLTILLSELQERGIVIHIVALCETFLTETNSLNASLENYRSVHIYRNEKFGGGTLILIHKCKANKNPRKSSKSLV